ncbi:uncharacterized protein SCHCODRAFT_02626391 [Schizophyllum commune H4-8]|uniref:uncharacterized protein n=1 Tax=Schizophyllum commune (strain H4-8 / FGSC 9210) TaxID=578458 RepID=UPI00215FE95B|nr:uncharacterized protein SCHCODRAFT_02626391 [Schizophyllum commune H4-8]KAI5892527.1 hypothetical protein SCHCODRAFT_02626391 [Schizophyllum commune H4-8]
MRLVLITVALSAANLVQATSTSISSGCGDACIAQLGCRATGADARICHCRLSSVPAILECLLDVCASDEERFEADAAFGAYCGGF